MNYFRESKLSKENDLFGYYIISEFDLAYDLSKIIDLVNPTLSNHHHRVAYIAAAIASNLNLPPKTTATVIIASLIHDIGLMLQSEINDISKFDLENYEGLSHAKVGAYLVQRINSFKHLANIIENHHNRWIDNQSDNEALIIHLADRIDVLLKRGTPAYYQRKEVTQKIKSNRGNLFKPEHVDAFLELYDKEFFWLDLDMPDKNKMLRRYFTFEHIIFDKEELVSFTMFLSQIIDFRCSFTATHSAGVSEVAYTLGRLCGLPEHMQVNLKIAGFLHDLGKLAISPAIINKNGELLYEEKVEIKKHPYYTFYALNSLDIFENIKHWAAFHHEFLDGSGYPFHLHGKRLDKGCRIMTVADIFTAVTEDRPYRKGMKKEDVKEILSNLVTTGKIDKEIVGVLLENYEEIDTLRTIAQNAVSNKYNNFKELFFSRSQNN